MFWGTLEASLLGNMLAGKGMLRAGYGNKEGKGIVRTGYRYSIKKLFDFTLSFNKLWNIEVLLKWT